jgi:hypothetical protein
MSGDFCRHLAMVTGLFVNTAAAAVLATSVVSVVGIGAMALHQTVLKTVFDAEWVAKIRKSEYDLENYIKGRDDSTRLALTRESRQLFERFSKASKTTKDNARASDRSARAAAKDAASVQEIASKAQDMRAAVARLSHEVAANSESIHRANEALMRDTLDTYTRELEIKFAEMDRRIAARLSSRKGAGDSDEPEDSKGAAVAEKDEGGAAGEGGEAAAPA